MKLKEMKEWLNKLPASFDDFSVVNGEYGYVTPEDKESLVYRVDKPILAMVVDEQSSEVLFLHQTKDDVNEYVPN